MRYFVATILIYSMWSALTSLSYAESCSGPGRQLNLDRNGQSYSGIGGRLLLLRRREDPKPYLVEANCLLLSKNTFWFDGRRTSFLYFGIVNYFPAQEPVAAAVLVQATRRLSKNEPEDKLNVYRNKNWLDAEGKVLSSLEEPLKPGTTAAKWDFAHSTDIRSLQASNEVLGSQLHAWLVPPSISSWDYRTYLKIGTTVVEDSRRNIWATTELIRFTSNADEKHQSIVEFNIGVEGEGDIALSITSTLPAFSHRYLIRIE